MAADITYGKATLKDVDEISRLVGMPKANVSRSIRDFFIARHKKKMLGVIAISIVDNKSAQIHSFATVKSREQADITRRLVQLSFYEAEILEVKRINCLKNYKFLDEFKFKKSGKAFVAPVPDAEKMAGLTQFY